ncbi:MAG: aminotransferase class I/II-fold pyridoxal phosphate-dependent enzyme [Candidatus Berkiella sp.]
MQTRLEIVQKEWLNGEGLDVDPVFSRLSNKSIDASTGSSAFAPPQRIEDEITQVPPSQFPEYHNHIPQEDLVKAAEKYFKQIGVLPLNATLKQDIYEAKNDNDLFSVIGHGTTHLFTSSLQSIIKTKGDVIIVTQPTYGLFAEPILENGGVIAPLLLNKDHHFKPNPVELESIISSTNAKLIDNYFKHIQLTCVLLNAYLSEKKINIANKKKILKLIGAVSKAAKSNKTKDFSLIDNAQESYNSALKALINDHVANDEVSFWLDKLRLPLCQRVRGYLHMNPHMPIGNICSQSEIDKLAKAMSPFNDLQVIDDLTYYDIVMSDAKTSPGTFAKSSLMHRTLTLYGLSKQFALASIRAGYALGPKKLIKPICEDIFRTNNTPNIFTRDAFYSIFNWPQSQRKEYLEETNKEYTFRREFTMALIQGQNKQPSKDTLKKIKSTLKSIGISQKEQDALLKGIPGLKVVVKPESGFFLIIDFSHYQGKYIGTTQLNQSRDFRNAFYCLTDLNTIPGEMMYMFDQPVLRFSYSMLPKEIVEAVIRMKGVLNACQTKPMTAKEIAAIEKQTKPKPAAKSTANKFEEKEISKVFLPKYERTKQEKRESRKIKGTLTTVTPGLYQSREKGKRKVKPRKITSF